MSEADDANAQPLIVVARGVKTRGLKGEIVADLLTDFPERFDDLLQLVAVAPNRERLILDLENKWFQKDRVILKFKGYDNIEASTPLIGYDFAVPEADRVALTEGSFYEWELEGCDVETTNGAIVGSVIGVVPTGGVALLAIRNSEQREILVPMAESIVVEVDIEKKRIVIDPPEGLLEL